MRRFWIDPRDRKEWKVDCVGGMGIDAPVMGTLEEEPKPWGLMFQDDERGFWIETGAPLKPKGLTDKELREFLDRARGEGWMNEKPLVLVVEDDPNHAILIRAAFVAGDVRFPLRVVGDGQEAIDYLSGEPPFDNRTRNPLPAAIILDLHLPRLSGFDVLEWIRDKPRLQDIPVLVFTNSSNPDDAERAYALGARAYRQKPADFSVLVGVIEELVGRVTEEKRADGTMGA